MTISRIPVSARTPYYEIEVELDGVEFLMEFRHNSRDNAWYLKILNTNDEILRCGIKIVNDWPLLRLWKSEISPDGEIVTVNQGQIEAPPDINQLGTDVLLHYLDKAEIDSLG